uniref:Uncharacterized protein n=1 Tax=Acrobeloides nanus TaxID=290746 RepID=A0A914CCH4_9BILA
MSFHTCCFHFGEAKLLKQSIEEKKKTISTSFKLYIFEIHGFTPLQQKIKRHCYISKIEFSGYFNYHKTPQLGSFIGYHFNKRRNNIFGSSLMDNLIMSHQWPVTS